MVLNVTKCLFWLLSAIKRVGNTHTQKRKEKKRKKEGSSPDKVDGDVLAICLTPSSVFHRLEQSPVLALSSTTELEIASVGPRSLTDVPKTHSHTAVV